MMVLDDDTQDRSTQDANMSTILSSGAIMTLYEVYRDMDRIPLDGVLS